MTQPTRHSATGIYRLRLTIPAELRGVAERRYGTRREFVANLRTRDRREAARIAPEALASLQAKLETVRAAHTGQGRRLSEREIRAIAGQEYLDLVRRHENNPSAHDWKAGRIGMFDEAAGPA